MEDFLQTLEREEQRITRLCVKERLVCVCVFLKSF